MAHKIVQNEHRIGYWSWTSKSKEFVPLTNFGIHLTNFVEAPPILPDYGFLAKATQLIGRQGLQQG